MSSEKETNQVKAKGKNQIIRSIFPSWKEWNKEQWIVQDKEINKMNEIYL